MSFFSALFSGRLGLDGKILDEPFEMDETHLADFLNDDLAKLNDADRDTLEQRFNIEEMEDCMKALPNHKAPGWDELPYEIYKKIFPIIQIDFLNVQNCISERERLTSGMRKSVTRLPPKIKEGVPTLLQY